MASTTLSFLVFINMYFIQRDVNDLDGRTYKTETSCELLTDRTHDMSEHIEDVLTACDNRTQSLDINISTSGEDISGLYINAKYTQPYKVYSVDSPEKHKRKIYTEYTAVTLKSSLQYKLLNSDVDGDGVVDRYHDEESGVRIVIDQYGVARFCVAVGTYWAEGKIGRLIDFIMENGAVIPCVTCDVKQDVHTMNEKGKYGHVANDLIEFYIDPAVRPFVDSWEGVGLRYVAGDVSTARDDFVGAVTKVIVYDDYITGFEDQ